MLQLVLHTLWVAALIYAGACVLYFLIQEKFIFVPTLPGEPFEIKLASPTQEFMIDTPYGGCIHTLLIQSPQSKGLIFYLHGNTGSLKRWQFMAEEAASHGYDVFVMDYRGYGKSTGKRTEAILHRDVEFCYDWIIEQHKPERKVIYGRSLGTGFATRLASRREADMLVLETPYFNFIDVAQYYLPFLPVRWLLRYKFRSDLYLKNVSCRTHIFHGTKDLVVPYKSALKLFRSVPESKSLTMTVIPGGKHSNLNRFPLFRERLKNFLK
ncbi:MAG: hypothetical protein RLZZ77_1236 [Bacteroidota bacterium]